MASISITTIDFLIELSVNNNRAWFEAHKEEYTAARENVIELTADIIKRLSLIDSSVADLEPSKCLFRIYRDVRFSKDKSPYKNHFGVQLGDMKKNPRRSAYYIHITPEYSFLAGGMYNPDTAMLAAFRNKISRDGVEFLQIINEPTFQEYFTVSGEKLVNIPKTFSKDDPMADYLKYKEFTLIHHISDKQLEAKNSAAYCAKIFESLHPFNEFIDSIAAEIK